MSVTFRITIGAATLTLLASAVPPLLASADPGGMCTYAVSAPRSDIGPGGAKVVTTTLTVTSCPDTWQPTKAAVCLAPSSGPGTCATVYGWGPGRVNVPVTSDDGEYRASGQGCGRLNPEVARCVAITPARANIGRD